MLAALSASGLLPGGGEAPVPAELTPELALALTKFLALTPCRLVAIQLEDLAGVKDRANLPGTIAEHPNWRRKLPMSLGALAGSPDFIALTRAVAEERPRR